MKQTRLIHHFAQCARCLLIALALATNTTSQRASQPAPPQAPAQPASQSGASLPPIQLDGNEVLHHLNQVISLYRHSTMEIRDVGLPSDAIYQDSAKALGAGGATCVSIGQSRERAHPGAEGRRAKSRRVRKHPETGATPAEDYITDRSIAGGDRGVERKNSQDASVEAHQAHFAA